MAALDLSKGFVLLNYILTVLSSSKPQIRIVSDTHADEKKNASKKKKKNRGYAFIVYEREKDMKGKKSLRACSQYLAPRE